MHYSDQSKSMVFAVLGFSPQIWLCSPESKPSLYRTELSLAFLVAKVSWQDLNSVPFQYMA